MNRKYVAVSTIRKYVSSNRGKKLPVLIGSFMPTKLYKYKSLKGSVAQCEAISPRPSKRPWPAAAFRPCRSLLLFAFILIAIWLYSLLIK